LSKHFDKKYSAEGAFCLPVLALYAAYQCLHNNARFGGKALAANGKPHPQTQEARTKDIDIITKRAFMPQK
jgi:DNA (cytosine-5)-methyltransferase 1